MSANRKRKASGAATGGHSVASAADAGRFAEAVLHGIVSPAGFPRLPDDWKLETSMISASDHRTKLFTMRFIRKDAPAPERRRVLAVVHGMGEHAGRYLHFVHYFREVVDEVALIDQRGHGRSEGVRGHVDRFDDLAADVAQWLESMRARELHLFGHSMGGLVVLRLCKNHRALPLMSVSVSAPLLGIKVELPAAKRAAAHVLSRVWGKLLLTNELDPGLVSRDPAVVDAYVKDHLVHDLSTPRFYTELLAAIDDTQVNVKKEPYPIAFFIPKADGIVDAEATIAYANALKAPAKEVHVYDDCYHEAFNDLDKDRCFEDAVKWIRKNSRSGAP